MNPIGEFQIIWACPFEQHKCAPVARQLAHKGLVIHNNHYYYSDAGLQMNT